jgi:hypothetical protein
MTRGLGGPRVENDGRGREAEGGLSAPVVLNNPTQGTKFLGKQKKRRNVADASFAACG